MFRNENGFTLTEMVISFGLISVVSVVTLGIYQDFEAGQSYNRALSEINTNVRLIEKTVNGKKECLELLGGRKAGALTSLTHTTEDGRKNVLLEDGKDYGDYFLKSDSYQSIKLVKSPIGEGFYELHLNYRIKNSGFLKKNPELQIVSRKITFLGSETTDKGIVDCGRLVGLSNLSAAEELCKSFGEGAVWDGSRCKLKPFMCGPGEVMKDFEQLGKTGGCKNLLDLMDLNDLFETGLKSCTNKPVFSLTIKQGKVAFECSET